MASLAPESVWWPHAALGEGVLPLGPLPWVPAKELDVAPRRDTEKLSCLPPEAWGGLSLHSPPPTPPAATLCHPPGVLVTSQHPSKAVSPLNGRPPAPFLGTCLRPPAQTQTVTRARPLRHKLQTHRLGVIQGRVPPPCPPGTRVPLAEAQGTQASRGDRQREAGPSCVPWRRGTVRPEDSQGWQGRPASSTPGAPTGRPSRRGHSQETRAPSPGEGSPPARPRNSAPAESTLGAPAAAPFKVRRKQLSVEGRTRALLGLRKRRHREPPLGLAGGMASGRWEPRFG